LHLSSTSHSNPSTCTDGIEYVEKHEKKGEKTNAVEDEEVNDKEEAEEEEGGEEEHEVEEEERG
jgi:hypothetical protein